MTTVPPNIPFECYMVNDTALVNGSNEKKWYCSSILYLPQNVLPSPGWRTLYSTEGSWRLAALVPVQELHVRHDGPRTQNAPERRALDKVFRSMYAYHPVGP